MPQKKSNSDNSPTTLPQFKNPALLEKALTHRSALNEEISSAQESNERLEFLGDAVLELVVTRYLFDSCPQEPEGILTAYRSALVKTTTLAQLAQTFGLGEKLYLSRGEERSGGRTNPSLLADTLESVIGAIYLDAGFKSAESFILSWLPNSFQQALQQKLYKDAKSELQERAQAKKLPTPQYQVLSESGPDHDKEFEIAVLIGEKVYGKGIGKSKQIAQQQAAQQALTQLEKSA